jgi:hypothetical protein
MLSPAVGTGIEQDHLTPRTARLLKGVTWGAFAATAIAGIALLAANSTSAGTYVDDNGRAISNALWRPGWAVAGISIGLLGLAIPTTIVIERATKNGTATTPLTNSSPQVLCPAS